ncbi:THUMP-like domain-containing protein [Tomitella fengzijianii]|uniref:Class I SAM-dependent methyltransferase n=1 Tax=Tomitella fengzijianii TaxID=2597660 RepID=A0A516X441_9ACTN|nr:class I SAM-dependent methyltransferase [Tomitella fengzijianii]QDQ97763.1 class I SAM-dependent methyltransferase [Tomitella fengzijianii]
MGFGFTGEDVAYLRSAEGGDALAAVAQYSLTTRTHLADLAAVRARFGAHASALIETVRLRRKASAKLDRADRWLLTDDALQQATPHHVAAARARRLAGRRVHDVTCSVGAELSALAGQCEYVVGSDIDPVRLAMAQHNIGAGSGVALLRADALVPVTAGTVVVADPARRAGGRRRHDPAALMPPLPELIDAYAGRDLVIKCAPGLDAEALGWRGEVEVVSLDGGVREACLWSGSLGEAGVRRRATVLHSAGPEEQYTDALPDEIPDAPPGRWIVDPDGAVVRAGLVRHYAAAHGLWQLDPRIAYLTGDDVPYGARGHRVLEQVRFADKPLRQVLRAYDCGALEILVRGVDVDPDALRRRLKPRGSRSLSLVVTRIGRASTVFVCEPTVGGTAPTRED